MTPFWKGPYEDGITQSLIQKFRQCPYRFYLYAILGIQDARELHPNLIWGDIFHKGLEHYIRTRDLNFSVVEMHKYMTLKHPNAPSTYLISTKGLLQRFELTHYVKGSVIETEKTFDLLYELPNNRTVRLKGKLDVYGDHPDFGRYMGEHKCKGYIDPTKTKKELVTDLQVNVYAYLHELEWVLYDLILIPEAIKYKPQRKHYESTHEYMERLIQGDCGASQQFPVVNHRHLWINNIQPTFISRESQERYWQTTVEPFLNQMCDFWEYVTQPGFDHEDPKWFNSMFYKTPARMFNGSYTENFECDYYNHLIGHEELSDLVPVNSMFAELEEL